MKPPLQAGLSGKLWLLKKGAYGISDGGRLFNLKLVQELKNLGMHQEHSDGTLFTYIKDGKLQGLIVSHVDDLLIMGNSQFEIDIEKKLSGIFIFSKMEKKSFKYCGCKISVEDNGDILLDQIDYVSSLKEIGKDLCADNRELMAKEIKVLIGKIGET